MGKGMESVVGMSIAVFNWRTAYYFGTGQSQGMFSTANATRPWER